MSFLSPSKTFELSLTSSYLSTCVSWWTTIPIADVLEESLHWGSLPEMSFWHHVLSMALRGRICRGATGLWGLLQLFFLRWEISDSVCAPSPVTSFLCFITMLLCSCSYSCDKEQILMGKKPLQAAEWSSAAHYEDQVCVFIFHSLIYYVLVGKKKKCWAHVIENIL